jgi:hypothetical protein
MTDTGKYLSFNISRSVGVRVTDVGRELYESYWREVGIEASLPKADDDGFVWLQMWEVMKYFGAGYANGCPSPTETTIRLERGDVE